MIAPFCEKARNFIRRPPALDAAINILEGSIRSGKTWAMIPKFLVLCRYKVPGRRVILGVSKQTVFNNVLGDLFDFIGPANYRYNRHNGELWLFDSKWLVIGAKDEGSEKFIRGLTVGVAVVDEGTLIPQSSFDMLRSRMSPDNARMYITTNPETPFHYLKEDFLDRADLRAKGDVWSEHFVLEDNLSLSQAKIDEYHRMYHGVFYQRFILGLWVIAQGAIYGSALDDKNLYTNDERPVGLRAQGGHIEHAIAVDYGTVNPCVFIDVYDTGKIVYWDREYYWDSAAEMRQKTDAEYADDLFKFLDVPAGGNLTVPVILDPSAASFRAELNKRGVYVIDADNEVADGLRMTSSMLANKTILINKEQCPKGLREMQAYAWHKKKSENGTEEPVKQYDHYPDAGRYYIKTRIPPWRCGVAA